MGIYEDLKEILGYLADEETHFWENCNCSEKIQETQDVKKCVCEENENHIYRNVLKVDDWIDSPSCQLMSEVKK